jgi:hypothetical protein
MAAIENLKASSDSIFSFKVIIFFCLLILTTLLLFINLLIKGIIASFEALYRRY